MNPLFSLFGTVFGGITEHFKSKAAIKKAKVDGEIQLIQTASTDVAAWEQLQAQASSTSWKDEYWTIVLSIPAIMSFIPGTVQYVVAGFEALSEMPEWYQYLLLIAIGASFGIKLKNGFTKK